VSSGPTELGWREYLDKAINDITLAQSFGRLSGSPARGWASYSPFYRSALGDHKVLGVLSLVVGNAALIPILYSLVVDTPDDWWIFLLLVVLMMVVDVYVLRNLKEENSPARRMFDADVRLFPIDRDTLADALYTTLEADDRLFGYHVLHRDRGLGRGDGGYLFEVSAGEGVARVALWTDRDTMQSMVHVGTFGISREVEDPLLSCIDEVASRSQQDGPPSKE